MWSGKDAKKQPKPVVILCAGEGRRLLAVGKMIPKAMVTVLNRPIISYVIDYWRGFAERFIFLVGYKKEQIVSFVDGLKLPLAVQFVEQEKPAGIAHAVNCAQRYILKYGLLHAANHNDLFLTLSQHL